MENCLCDSRTHNKQHQNKHQKTAKKEKRKKNILMGGTLLQIKTVWYKRKPVSASAKLGHAKSFT